MNAVDPQADRDTAAVYRARAARFDSEWDALLVRRRLVLLALAVLLAAAFAAIRLAVPARSSGLLTTGLLLFFPAVGCAVLWLRLGTRAARAVGLAAINEEAGARLALAWDDLPLRHTVAAGLDHPFAADLDLFGRASLFQRLEGATTPVGEATLALWLMEGACTEAVVARQQSVAELAPLIDFRQSLALVARDIGADGPDPTPLVLWAEEPRPLLPPAIAWAARASPVAGWALLVAQLIGVVAAPFWLIFLVVNLAINQLAGSRALGAPQALWQQQHVLRPYASAMSLLAGSTFEAPLLRRLQDALRRNGGEAGRELRRLGRLARFSFPMSFEFYWPVQALFLLDVNVIGAADRWRARNGAHVRDWVAGLGEGEALAALAVLAHDHPDWAFPQVDATATTVRASGLGHPLIPAGHRVVNDVEFGPPGTFLFVTGSNMSGKSTLLRAIGVNLVLAGAGAPVCAAALRTPPTTLWTAMRVQDSLARGESYFLAEVLRLRALVEAARRAVGGDGPRFVYLIDEIFQGTNSAERRIAGRRVLRELLRLGAIGAVSTHDLSLAAGGTLAGAAQSVHFTEIMEADGERPTMSFDYRLRPGIASSTNALLVLAMVGLELEDDPEEVREDDQSGAPEPART